MLFNPAPALIRLFFSASFLVFIIFYGTYIFEKDIAVNFSDRHFSPDAAYWFGTDNLGRDLWSRCFQGAIISLQIGIGAAVISSFIAITLALFSRISKHIDDAIRLLTDAMLSLPHLLLLILICFTFGGGKEGVLLAVSLTHWPRLFIVLRAEAEKVEASDYLLLTRRLGRSHLYCFWKHYLPVLLPQWITGALLIFPHAILHAAALSFLGFGLTASEPSLGLLLADALRFISRGNWWMVLFPGLMLFLLVLLADQIAKSIKSLWLRSEHAELTGN